MRLLPLTCALLLSSACFEETKGGNETGTGGDATSGSEDGDATTAGTSSDDGAGTSDTTDPGTSASTTGSSGPAPASCEDYCSFMDACDADFPQYSTVGPCLSVCEMMPLGSSEDQTGNSVGCRTFYAIQAGEGTDQKEDFCQNAGPAGNDVCGGFCESFCAIADQACTGANEAFASIIDCTSACRDWDMMDPYSANTPEGDTYACRLKHLTYATLDPGTHCGHVTDASPVCA